MKLQIRVYKSNIGRYSCIGEQQCHCSSLNYFALLLIHSPTYTASRNSTILHILITDIYSPVIVSVWSLQVIDNFRLILSNSSIKTLQLLFLFYFKSINFGAIFVTSVSLRSLQSLVATRLTLLKFPSTRIRVVRNMHIYSWKYDRVTHDVIAWLVARVRTVFKSVTCILGSLNELE